MVESGLLRLRFDYEGPPTRGAELVERLLTTGEGPDGDLTPAEAREAVAVLEQLQSLWFVDQMVEGGEMLAEQVHTAVPHGLQELVQNADDHGATELRIAHRKTSREIQLLVAHDGKPVELRDLLLMTYALLSGSRDDPERIGRFGIGLKTLNQISERMSVHCPPFGVEISGGKVRAVKSPPAIAGYWSPQKRETLFVLKLRDSAPSKPFFRRWLADEWDASSMLFLRTLRRVSFVDLRTRRVLAEKRLVADKETDKVNLDIRGGNRAERLVLRDSGSVRRWTRYIVRYPSPQKLQRTHKALGPTTTLGIAIPDRGPIEGRLFAGLPLDEPSRLPFSLGAQFDIDVSRTEIREQPNGFNEWLLDRLGDLVVAVALHRFAVNTRSGWRAVPVEGDTAGEAAGWLEEHLETLIERVHDRLRGSLRLRLSRGLEVRTEQLIFEDQPLDGLLSESDLAAITAREDRHALPKRHRDGAGRWRSVLWDLGADRIDTSNALEILDWEDNDLGRRTPAWFVRLAAAAIEENAGDALWERRWVLTSGSTERLSPSEIAGSGVLLVHGGVGKGLAARLKQTRPLARAFVAQRGPARTVRTWLTEKGVLSRHPDDADALSALARGDGSDPVDLRRDDRLLVRLRDAFAELSAEIQHRLGQGIGRNIVLRGYVYKNGIRRAAPTTPCEAYLPSSIEKHEGWVKAAARCEEIRWLHRDYAKVLRAGETRGLGALAFLRALGAGVSPRLLPADPESEMSAIDEEGLSPLQREELKDIGFLTHVIGDFVSPDLDRVMADIQRERRATLRRGRARALFLALHNNWREYAERTQATPCYYRYQWIEFDPISATWLGRAASEAWLTTQEKGLHPKAPRELVIDTGTALAEFDRSQYADEIDPQYADSPAAEALGMEGRTRASTLVETLIRLRDAERKGEAAPQRQLDRIYAALASYCPGGANESKSDLSPSQLRIRFGRPTASEGLVRVGNAWLPPARVRRGPYLGDRLAWVEGSSELWVALGVPESDIKDCIGLLEALARDKTHDRAAEIRIFRRLSELLGQRRKDRVLLRQAPLRTAAGWTRERPVFAVANPAVARSLAGKMAIWEAPLPLDEVEPLLSSLGVEVLDEATFEPNVSTRAAAAGATMRPAWEHAVGHFADFLTVHAPELHATLGPERWRALMGCDLAIGTDWLVRVPRPSRRAAQVRVPAYLFDGDSRLFCAVDEDAAGSFDSGGQAIASFFPGDGLNANDRAFLAMAWERAFEHREEKHTGLDLTPEGHDGENEVELPLFRTRRSGTVRQPRKRLRARIEDTSKAPPRQLIDPDETEPSMVKISMASGGRRGKLRIVARRPLKPAGPTRTGNTARSAASRGYDVRESEEVGYRLMEKCLAERGIELDDTRDQPNVGADGVDRKNDLYFELKAHGREASDEIRLQGAGAERAEKKKNDYWLVIASGLEQGLQPELLFISNPLERLDVYYGGGVKLTGIRSATGTKPPRR
jgi:hypothetical protein